MTIDGVGVTYDALGRMVEQNRSGTYTEIVYASLGAKLALMSGQTLTKAFIPLTGGAVAVYNSSGLVYYRHSDHLGSSRFASTPSRTMYSDGAYGPFGEPYAQSGTTDASFTGMNQDTVANLYDFAAREYGIQGRWPSPDPLGKGAASLRNPQSFNRYAYLLNSPMNMTDAGGLLCRVDVPMCNLGMSGFMDITSDGNGGANASGDRNGGSGQDLGQPPWVPAPLPDPNALNGILPPDPGPPPPIPGVMLGWTPTGQPFWYTMSVPIVSACDGPCLSSSQQATFGNAGTGASAFMNGPGLVFYTPVATAIAVIAGPAVPAVMEGGQIVLGANGEFAGDFVAGLAASNGMPPITPGGITGWAVGNILSLIQ